MVSSVTNDRCHEYRGLSTDEKPGIAQCRNGSVFLEMDTGRVFVFDEQNEAWVEL